MAAAPYETEDAAVYSTVAGNKDGLFAVNSGTGAFLARVMTPAEAEDGHGQKAAVTATVPLTTE